VFLALLPPGYVLRSLIALLKHSRQLLNEYSNHEVHLYEADPRAGGHANTVRFVTPGLQRNDGVDVDTCVFLFFFFPCTISRPQLTL